MDDIVVCRKRELGHDVVCVQEMVLSKATGLVRDRTYAGRLYRPQCLRTLPLQVGFFDVEVGYNIFVHHPDADIDYDLATNRMLIIATKG